MNRSITDSKKLLNNTKQIDLHAKNATKKFLKVFCNENCKDTLFEVGDTNKIIKIAKEILPCKFKHTTYRVYDLNKPYILSILMEKEIKTPIYWMNEIGNKIYK